MEGNVRLPLLPLQVVVLKKNEQYVNNISKSCKKNDRKVETIYILIVFSLKIGFNKDIQNFEISMLFLFT